MMVLAGFVALREPDGQFCPSVPVYRDMDDVKDEMDGMPWDELIAYFDELVKKQAKKEREQ